MGFKKIQMRAARKQQEIFNQLKGRNVLIVYDIKQEKHEVTKA